MSCFSKSICEVKGIEVFSSKKPKGYQGKPQNTATKVVVINERDIFNLSTPFGDRAIINNQVTILHSVLANLQEVEDSCYHGIEK
jgi:hypothetical protein